MDQRLEKSYGLNEHQLSQIGQLEAACNQAEELTMKLNWGALQRRPRDEINDFLYYQGDRLIGYLALYSFNQREAEVSAMTDPIYRRQGIFKRLLASAQTELKQRGIPDFLFICEQSSLSGALCMAAVGARYEFSEYKMTLKEAGSSLPGSADLHIRPALAHDIDELAHMDQICFGVPPGRSKQYLEQDLSDNKRWILIAIAGREKVGKLGVSLTGSESLIFALCVLPEYRRRGYGSALLGYALKELQAQPHGHISLEVACTNESALSLYTRCGFQVITAYDYYRLPV